MKKFYSLLIALLALVGVAQAQTVVFDIAANPWKLPLGSGTGETAAAGNVSEIVQDGVTLSLALNADKGTPPRMWTGNQLRIYTNNALTFTAGGKTIKKVVFTYVANNNNTGDAKTFSNDVDDTTIASNEEWSGSVTSITFSPQISKGSLNVSKIEVTLQNDDPNYVETPKISPATGTYYAAQEVTITADEGCTIYYTTDGSNPKASDAIYAGPFTVEKTTTVKAVAVKGDNMSEVASSIITISILPSGDGDGSLENPYNYVAATAIASALASGAKSDDVYVKGKVSKITYAFDAQHGTATFFITDDGNEADNQFQVYSTYFLGNRSWKDGDTQIKVGDDVIIYGKLTNYQGTPETAAKESCLYSLNGEKAPEIVYTEFNTFAAAKAAAPAAEADAVNAQLNLNEAIVVFVNGQSVYLNDKEHGMLVYGTNSKNLKAGDIVSGTVKGKLYKRNGNTQVSNPVYDVNVVESGFGILPHKVAAADLLANGANYENELVLIEYLVPQATALDNRNINFDAYPDDSFDKSVGVVAVRDNWNIATELVFNEETPYAVTGFVTLYTKNDNTVVQIYPRTAADLDNGEVQPEYEFAGDGTLEKPYTAEDVRHKVTEKDVDLETQVIVKAYIVGYISGNALNANSVIFSAAAPEGKTVTESNILVADAADASTIAEVLPINLPNGFVREGLNLAANPTNLGKQVWLRGDITKYMGVSGLKDVKDYSFDGVNFTAVRGIAAEAAPAAKTIYNVAGQRMQNLNKAGLYIVNGKKVVVK